MSYLIYKGSPLGMVPQDAEDIDFDNSGTELSSTNVQDAIEEVYNKVIDLIYPVGSVITTTASTNPSTYWTGTTWVRKAKGRVLVGVDENDTAFDTVGETGGNKTINLQHNHTVDNHTHGMNHSHGLSNGYADIYMSGTYGTLYQRYKSISPNTWTSNYGLTATFGAMGGGVSHNEGVMLGGSTDGSSSADTGGATPNTNSKLSTAQSILQPFETVYFWERTA